MFVIPNLTAGQTIAQRRAARFLATGVVMCVTAAPCLVAVESACDDSDQTVAQQEKQLGETTVNSRNKEQAKTQRYAFHIEHHGTADFEIDSGHLAVAESEITVRRDYGGTIRVVGRAEGGSQIHYDVMPASMVKGVLRGQTRVHLRFGPHEIEFRTDDLRLALDGLTGVGEVRVLGAFQLRSFDSMFSLRDGEFTCRSRSGNFCLNLRLPEEKED